MIENIAHTKGLYGAAVNGNFIVKERLCHALLRLIIDADPLAGYPQSFFDRYVYWASISSSPAAHNKITHRHLQDLQRS